MRCFLLTEVVVIIFFISILLICITIGDNGYIKFCMMKLQICKKQSEIQKLAMINYELTKANESLQNENSFLIEKMAREELMLIKPGELVYLVQTKE
jgi:cell division protein FtsB